MRVMTRLLMLVGCLVVALVAKPMAQGGGAAPGGQRSAPQPLTNIKVLPKEWTRQQVVAYMQTVAPALGVMCDNCHVSTADRASDEKPAKLVARKMMAMVNAINDTYLKDVGEPAAAGTQKVTCYTCHRGTLKPLSAKPSGGF